VHTLTETAKARAQKSVAVTFFLLAPYIVYDAVTTLAGRDHARTSWLGIGLAIASLIAMPALGVAKRRLGARLDSAATAGEAPRTCCAPTWPSRYWPGCWPTPCSAGGGWTWSSRWVSPVWPYGKASKPGTRGMLLRRAGSPVVPHPTADGNGRPASKCGYAQLRRPHVGYSACVVMRSRRRWLHLLFR